MAQFVQTSYEQNPGTKPRLLVLFQPVPENCPHTEAELKAALAAAEKALRSSWAMNGKAAPKPSEESRHVSALRKDLATLQTAFDELKAHNKDISDDVIAYKLAAENAEAEARHAHSTLSELQVSSNDTKKQLADLRQKFDAMAREFQEKQNELLQVQKQLQMAKEQLDVLRTPPQGPSQTATTQSLPVPEPPKSPEHPRLPDRLPRAPKLPSQPDAEEL